MEISAEQTLTLKIPEAAGLARCGEAAIRRGVRQGYIPTVRGLGRNILIPRAAFLRWIDAGGNDSQPAVPRPVRKQK